MPPLLLSTQFTAQGKSLAWDQFVSKLRDDFWPPPRVLKSTDTMYIKVLHKLPSAIRMHRDTIL